MLLKIPIDSKLSFVPLCFFENGKKGKEIFVRLADEQMECWEYYVLPGRCNMLELRGGDRRRGALAIQFLEETELIEAVWEKERPQFHLSPECGKLERICSLRKEGENWQYVLEHTMIEENEPVYRICESRDLLHWNVIMRFLDEEELDNGNIPVFRQRSGFKNWAGKVACVCWFSWDGKLYETAISRDVLGKKFLNLMSLPYERREEKLFPLPEIENLRVWERIWKDFSLEQPFEEELRFRIIPGRWPDIRITAPDYTDEDIVGELFEVFLSLEVHESRKIIIDLCGRRILWENQKIICGESAIEAKPRNGFLQIQFWADHGVMEILTDGKVLMEVWEEVPKEKEKPQPGIAENIDFNIGKIERHFLKIQDDSKVARIRELRVYGLRGIHGEKESWLSVQNNQRGEICYESPFFRVYENQIVDKSCGEPPAYVLKNGTIISPPRVVEEFSWRENGWGDMSRQVCRESAYCVQVPEGKFPELKTGILVLDMAYKIALDVFLQCGSRKYALPGQEDMWAAGLFQGKGEGFGVWLRDSTHVAIRCGNLIDREKARRTLRYTVGQGFENGTDGPAMAAVGIWDYYCATGDISLIYESWKELCERIDEAVKRFDWKKGLVRAEQSTSNDAFEEPEAGGFCLGTEIYYMDAFLCMEKMGKLLRERVDKRNFWGKLGRTIQQKIQTQYWNEAEGYFTSGPKGSKSYEKGYWETSGMEGAVWSRFGIADVQQKRRCLQRLMDVAMTEFGIDLFPYRTEKNHFCHASWGVWNAGFAAAANEIGNAELVWKLLMQQVRNAVINKTFYEVIDVDSGRAWRWPGQLWHAAGFISCIYYGLLGIKYHENGLYLHPLKQEHIRTIQLNGLHFGKGIYDILIQNNGTQLYLDGRAVAGIPQNLTGTHRLEYK